MAIVVPYDDVRAQGITGDLKGRIVAADGASLASARVEIAGTTVPGRRVVWTDSDGKFTALGMLGGRYRLIISRIGYEQRRSGAFWVSAGRVTQLGSIVIELDPVNLAPLLIAVPATVNNTSTAAVHSLGRELLDRLPVGRDYMSALTLLPQVNESYYGDGINISGATGLDNAFFIDGMNVTEPYRAQGGLRLPLEFIDHMQVNNGGLDAWHGRALGGVVNVVTRSGTNEFHATAFGHFSGSSLASSPQRGVGDLTTGRFRRYDAGFSIAGPLRKGRLWYFGAYDRSDESADVAVQGLGTRPDRSVSNLFALKLNWQPADGTEAALTWVGDPTARDAVGNEFFAPIFGVRSLANADPFLAETRSGGGMIGLNATHVLSRNLLLQGTVSRLTSRLRTGPATARGAHEPLVVDASTGTWSGGHGNRWDHSSQRWSASASLSMHRGQHSLRLGAQLETNQLDETWQWLSDGPGGAGWLLVTPAGTVGGVLDFRTTVRNHTRAVYGQGSILLHPRVRVNLGHRWDGQYFTGTSTGLRGEIPDQHQPRVGLALYPGQLGRQKITMSFSRFYEQLPNLPVSFAYGGLYQRFLFYAHDPFADPSPSAVSQTWYIGPRQLKGQHYDEITLGYEIALAEPELTLTARAIHRVLRAIIATTAAVRDTATLANPGSGSWSMFPRPKHDYDALELSVRRSLQSGSSFQLSYTFSRARGNYTGLFDQDTRVPNPNGGTNYTDTLKLANGVGLLPNDRPHVLKLAVATTLPLHVDVGTTFSWMSGTPLNEFGVHPHDPILNVFLRPRGTAGRTPAIWDWNVHASRQILSFSSGTLRGRVDILHAFSRQRVVSVIQTRYLGISESGTPTDPNPLYLAAIAHQPPMTVRLAVEARLGRR